MQIFVFGSTFLWDFGCIRELLENVFIFDHQIDCRTQTSEPIHKNVFASFWKGIVQTTIRIYLSKDRVRDQLNELGQVIRQEERIEKQAKIQ